METDDPRYPLYTPEFAEDPYRAYREMRSRFGSLVPVDLSPGVPATLVIGYHTALRVLNDPEHFPADPRSWQQDIPTDCPILPILEWRPISSRSTGEDYWRYRQATTSGIDGVDLYRLQNTVEKLAVPLINGFCQNGSADLISEFTLPLAFDVINNLLGCPPAIGKRVAAGMAAIFEGIEAEEGNKILSGALMELVALKRAEPGDDIATALLRHPAGLDELEMIHNLVAFYGTGIELEQNLIVNALVLILSDDRFGGDVMGGTMSTLDALDEVLFDDPPLANHLNSFPKQPILIDGVWLPAHQPIVISMTACNNDPAIRASDHTGNRSHLAWGAGRHSCPAQQMAYMIARSAIDQLLDALPEIRLAVPSDELVRRPGPFHRALTALPVIFPPSPPLNIPE